MKIKWDTSKEIGDQIHVYDENGAEIDMIHAISINKPFVLEPVHAEIGIHVKSTDIDIDAEGHMHTWVGDVKYKLVPVDVIKEPNALQDSHT